LNGLSKSVIQGEAGNSEPDLTSKGVRIMDNLNGCAAIVTGSATGMGAATAVRLAERGCNVIINYTKSEREARETVITCEDKGVEALLCRADVSEEDDCRRMVTEAVDRWGRIDILVNNAATTKFCDQHDLEGLHKDDFLQIFSVNVVGPYQMIRFVVPHMKKTGRGTIVNVASDAGITGIGSSTAYAASKGALITMTLSLARVLGPEIRVNAVCPGLTQTRWNKLGLGEERYEGLKSFCEDASPLHLVPTPEDIADVILYLIEGARVITGETLILDGGKHLNQIPLSRR
jgi:3-oxoacyl-[acyl-carrier protein] reductase